MTVLLILATFLVFLTMDYFYSWRRAEHPVAQDPKPAVPPRPRPSIVAGFELPDALRYHPGHTWALAESPALMRIGLDDFAARLIGKAQRLSLPQRGRWVRQGQVFATIYRDCCKTELVAPMEGMVADINEAALSNPELALRDPYGAGWLVTLQSPDAKTNFRNLLTGTVARKWMEEAAQRLLAKVPLLVGMRAHALAQDGGLAVRDLTAGLPDHDWMELTHEFLLS